MKISIWYRLDILTRLLTPFLLTLALVILNIVPLQIPGFSTVVPLLPLMAVYHWAVYRSELLPAYGVFIIGLLHDIFSGSPIGINTLVFLLVYGVVLWQHRFLFGKSFVIIWLGFAIVSAGAFVLTWALNSLWNYSVLEPRGIVYQYLLTVGVFPALAWVFMRWQQFIIRQL
ncbi:MAG: rod shape-determining protein MreD [Rhodospirillales bacterium]|nr:rod shape-determining protein MreD [Rhodospirillales bacterium]